MKTRIIGTLLVLAVLLTLFVLTGGVNKSPASPAVESQSQPSSSADNDLKSLKIN